MLLATREDAKQGKPMAPVDFTAAVAATLFARKLAEELGSQSSKSMWACLGRLAEIIRAKLHRDPVREAALEQVEMAPDDAGAVRTLADVLAECVAEDPSFGGELASAIANARQEPMIARFVTEITGSARVQKIVNVGVVHGDVSL